MVHTLASNGANSIWEHSLLDPAQVQSGRRKANPQDKLQWVLNINWYNVTQKQVAGTHWTYISEEINFGWVDGIVGKSFMTNDRPAPFVCVLCYDLIDIQYFFPGHIVDQICMLYIHLKWQLSSTNP